MTRKHYFFSLMVLLSLAETMALSSCSKDDDDVKREENIIAEMETDDDPPIKIDEVNIDFKLLNTDSIAMKTFKEHDDFFFVLSFTNNGNQDIDFPKDNDIIGDDFFRVYTSDGIYVGRPWDFKTTAISSHPILYAKSNRIIWCSWLSYSNRDGMPFQKIPGYELFKYPSRVFLPKGSYYSEFEITIHNGKKVKLRKEFKII